MLKRVLIVDYGSELCAEDEAEDRGSTPLEGPIPSEDLTC